MNELESFENAVADAQQDYDKCAKLYEENPCRFTRTFVLSAELKALQLLGEPPF